MDIWAQIILLFVLIVISAFFAAAEMAYSSLNKTRLKILADDGNRRARIAVKIAEDFDKMISTVLIANNIVNIASTSVATVLFINALGEGIGPTVSTVVMTVVILIFAEVSPKSVAKERPESFAVFAAPFLRASIIIITPLSAFFVVWKKLLRKVFGLKTNDAITGDELMSIVDEAEDTGGIDGSESNLIKSAISFSECPVGDILTPRVDLIAVSKDETTDEIAKIFDESGFSRLPVYDDTIDNIIGVIHIRDFNKYVLSKSKSLDSIVKNTVYIAKQMPISELLKLMQSKKTHMAVILDEYGGTVGIATMEDILEELVGEIWDEYDEVVEEFVLLPDGRVKVLCATLVDKMFEYFNLDAEAETDSVSVGGWVLEHLGKIAEEGDTFSYENLEICVTGVEERRVVEITVKVNEPVDENFEE